MNSDPNGTREFELRGKMGEEFIHNLATKTFLDDWCYLNPKLANGKELCDLLVVYGEIALLIQIKTLKLHRDGRYSRKEVEKNIRQLGGAWRHCFELDRLEVVCNPRRGEEPFDPSPLSETHLLSVLVGEGEDFYVPSTTVKEQFVHVIAGDSMETLLTELDTTADFVTYLRARKSLLCRNAALLIQGGEKELLAHYILNGRSMMVDPDSSLVLIEEGGWENLQQRPEYVAKQEADKVSYGWDSIISRAHESQSPHYEKIARELARTDRFERRCLSKAFGHGLLSAHRDRHNNIRRRAAIFGDRIFCFLYADSSMPREFRREVLWSLVLLVGLENPSCTSGIGIATENRLHPTCSYDYCLLETFSHESTEVERARRVLDAVGLTAGGGRPFRVDENEYPS